MSILNRGAQIYTVHEKLEAAEPSARVELVREGFSYAAFIFTILWLLSKRLWLASFCYAALLVGLVLIGQKLGLNTISVGLAQLLLQLLLGSHAYDLLRSKLAHQGYREAGVIVADSPVAAEQRYYAHIA